MIKKFVNSFLARFGYVIRRIDSEDRTDRRIFQLHKYLNEDGSFNYEQYRQIQTEGNKRKIEMTWVIEENISYLSEYIKSVIGSPQFGICHGTRRGNEQAWFRKYLNNCEVIGTEISDTAEQFPYTIQWDFHEIKPEWINATDFIYSNSFDHSYDPEKCLNAWMSCVKKDGLCIIEHTSAHEPSGDPELDPFKAELGLMPYLINTWGRGEYGVREILTGPAKGWVEFLSFIVIQRFK